MSQVFNGSVLLPGESGPGLSVSFELGSDFVRLLAGEDELGTWAQRECDVAPAGKGSFSMELGDESLTFTPASPSAFAEAMTVPLQPDPGSRESDDADKPKYDYDAAIDEVIARVMPLREANGHDEFLSKPMLIGIVGTAAVLMVGLVGMSLIV